ncbi:type II toxin-antitoxin system VapC family toxin [Zooshikella ganghwensis]|uniref:type II toxin-antitoxin system VapC family toxin n=1 Tax=Zooshikella ganghwensis TaxID=202772 RepID=UPI0003FB6BCB|nr:type II toxin-antitoxin system VapC family toxin [Zooshikella ganghwensis]
MYLLDTNVISQLMRLNPNAGVAAFFELVKKDKSRVYLSSLTIGEIQKGITKLVRSNDVKQANLLQKKMDLIVQEYAGSILPIDEDVSSVWGVILAKTDDTNAIDKLIAATGIVYGLTVVTRNVRHIQDTGVKYLNPFS